MRRNRMLVVGGAVALILILITIGIYLLPTHAKPSSVTTTPPASSRYWIMTKAVLAEMTANPTARATLARDTMYALAYNPSDATAAEHGLRIIPAKSYKSEAQFASDVAAHKIPAYVRAILYDNEPWHLTPSAEKQDPVRYYKMAYALAHAHGYTLIAAPVPNTIDPSIAPYADVIDVQAQYAQATAKTYLAAVEGTILKVKQANAHVTVLSGLSTNPTAGDPTWQQLTNIAHATFPHLTSGWWLNIPNPGTACPRCQQPRPDTALSFLKALGPVR